MMTILSILLAKQRPKSRPHKSVFIGEHLPRLEKKNSLNIHCHHERCPHCKELSSSNSAIHQLPPPVTHRCQRRLAMVKVGLEVGKKTDKNDLF